jgi:CelD/BcsL family acetyltransferase involved in cellulose biosynthesis/predicted ATP-grasp superfamily ATP-dependent carboligase
MTPRVIVTDAQERAVLAAIRCLGEAGYQVAAIGTSRSAPGLWSRSPAERYVSTGPRDSVERFLASVADVARVDEGPVVLPGTDEALLVISRHRDRLSPAARLGLPSHETVQRALDKACLAEAALPVGLAPADARVCRSPSEALDAAAAFALPVVVKPARTVVEVDGRTRRSASALVETRHQLEQTVETFGTSIVQRRLRGDVISFGGAMNEHGLLGFAVSRYLRTWRPRAGNVCFSETIAPPPGLVQDVESLVRRLGWVGIFELELIRLPDGKLVAIDFNPRPYGSLTLAVAAGSPLPSLWCDSLLARSGTVWCAMRTPTAARPGVRYRWEDADLRNVLWQLRHRNARRALAGVMPRRHVTHAYFRARDPAPLAARGVQLALAARDRTTPPAEEGVVIRRLDDLDAARGPWTSLAERSDNIFSTWEWADVWWRHFGDGRTPMITSVSVRDRPVAIVPIYAERRPAVKLARFLGHGVADQLGPVCRQNDVTLAIEAMGHASRGGRVLLAERMKDDRDWARETGGLVIHEEVSPIVALADEESWESYLRRHSANFRQQVRRRMRRLERLGLRYRLASDPGRLQSDFDSLLALHAARWGKGSSAFGGEREAFHREFAALALARGWLRLWLAEVDGQPIAAWYGFRFAGVEYYYQAGRDPAWDRYSIGAGILEHSIREAFADGMREYRLLRGPEGYKNRYATRESRLLTVVAARGLFGHATVATMGVLGGSATGRRLLRLEGD